MELGTHIVAQNVADLYEAPDSHSDLASQAVLGASVRVEEERNGFCRVATEDRYGGWINSRLLLPRDAGHFLRTTVVTLFAEVFSSPDPRSEMLTKLVVNSTLAVAPRPEVGSYVPVQVAPDQTGYVHKGSLSLTPSGAISSASLTVEDAVQKMDGRMSRNHLIAALGHMAAETAKRFIGTPYLWGGCTPFGIDCSGLTQLTYKLNGVQLLRDADLQFADRRFERVEEGQSLETAILEDGDLVVFSRREDRQPTHIGIALGDGRFLHARGGQGVRIDICDTLEYRQKYVGAIRLSPDADFSVEAA